MKRYILRSLCASAALVGAVQLPAQPTAVAGEGANGDPTDIIVTARKRAEFLIDVPASVTAVTGDMLEKRAINTVDALARTVPGLVTGEGGAGTAQGGVVVLRGISGPDANTFGDQAVVFNVDGVQIARSSIRRMGQMDLQQIEILKGPQALYYGKNSPGGVINIRSGDPTKVLTAKLSTGFEANAREWRTEGFVAGPLSDSIGFRVAGYYSDMDGWVHSTIPAGNIVQANHDRGPAEKFWATRGTLTFNDAGPFRAKLKFSYGKRTGDSATANVQYVDCPYGQPQIGHLDDCKADDRISTANPLPGFDKFDSRIPKDGHQFLTIKEKLGSLELNYDASDKIALTSITGYYSVDSLTWQNATYGYLVPRIFMAVTGFKLREMSQEVRLVTDFEGPLNFVGGLYFQDSRIQNTVKLFLGGDPATTTYLNNYLFEQKGNAYSAFGQLIYDITPTISIAGGARYSYEKKRLSDVQNGVPNRVPLTPVIDRISFNDVSPEATLTWKPSRHVTVYGSYKQSFLSGGFNASVASATGGDPTYKPQTTEGFEAGVKTSLLGGALRTDLAVYSYKTKGLQQQVTVQSVVQELRNAGAVRTKGVELSVDYRPPIEGLTLNGAIAYLDGKYLDYQASCYKGQGANSSVPCINQVSRVTGKSILAQDLSGTELQRAPKWTANTGFVFKQPIGGTWEYGLSGNLSYSDSYITTGSVNVRSPSYTLIDAGVRVGTQDGQWDIAFIGRNLTDKYYWTRSTDVPFTGANPGGPVEGTLADASASISRGRELMLRVTYRFGG